jgi:CysZ protein
VQLVFWFFNLFPWSWLEPLVQIGASLSLVGAFFFLLAPVTSLFAGLYLDKVASLVENMHYPSDRRGAPVPAMTSFLMSLQFAGLILLSNIMAIPFVILGFGVFVLLAINAYLLGREYFEMIAMRYMSTASAKELRKAHAANVFVAGLIPAFLALVPFFNFLTPLFSTSYFLHYFKQVQRS